MTPNPEIRLRGVRTHNLKNFECVFPHGKMTVITGVSGSGKSSLAFDTLYAEGQRRYVESLSTYARQFLDRMERPDIDTITGIQPAIALEQKNRVKSARSTVGTATEIQDFLRLLFAKLGETVCPHCQRTVKPASPDSALRTLEALPERVRLVILGPTELNGAQLQPAVRSEFVRSGYHRLWDGTDWIDLEADQSPRDPHAKLFVVIDRLILSSSNLARLHAALQTAFTLGRGRATVLATEPQAGSDSGGNLRGLPGNAQRFEFYAGMTCGGCGRDFPTPQPQTFSFNSPLGACPDCEGFGRVMELDLDKVIPNPELCIEDGAIAPWNSAGNLMMYDRLKDRTTPQQIPRLKPIKEFTPRQRSNLIDGLGRFGGIHGFFAYLERKKYRVQARVMLARYRAYRTCPGCKGLRLKPEALNVRLAGRTIAELSLLPVRLLRDHFASHALSARDREIAGRIFEALGERLNYLVEVGLGYLTLDRATRSLSGGEAQRINLATSLGSGLTQTLYVLDEPTVGLHPRDTHRLISILQSLRDLGNTIVVVEHDLDVIRAADRIVDLGPGAGEAGGQILFEGNIENLNDRDSPTTRHIASYHCVGIASRERPPRGWITIRGARGNNLKNLEVRIPLGCLCCVTGVSGSGKSTLIRDTLVAAYRRQREIAPVEVQPFDSIDGFDKVRNLYWVDQSPPARSRRSNPVTYVKAFDAIRAVLASSREARAAGLEPRHFSFNTEGGRCPECKGTGSQTIDMHFMADVEVICEACDGRRFQPHVLALRWHGKNIEKILNLTVDEASEFFSSQPRIVRALRPLQDVGLGYLRLGQNSSTLSGGEAQRLKIAGHLLKIREGEGLVFIFDEPTTGLHPADLERLLGIFHRLVDRGCSLIVIEHNLDLIVSCDYIIDLGPGGGDEGGHVVAKGTLREIVAEPSSITGHYLKERFGSSLGAQ